MKADAFGDRMKDYETRETGRRFLPYIPVYARIDGRGFSKFTRHAEKPFDTSISRAMISATTALVSRTNALIGYTQSDEISLVWMTCEPGEDMFFSGKVQKLASVLAGIATAAFMRDLMQDVVWMKQNPDHLDELPHFDARVCQLPNTAEAANMFLWREQDARKNSRSMLAHSHFSHKELQGKSGAQKVEMLAEKGVAYERFPTAFKSGTFLRRELMEQELPEDARMKIPEGTRPEAGSKIFRSKVSEIKMPPFNLVTNRAAVIFDGAAPITDVAE